MPIPFNEFIAGSGYLTQQPEIDCASACAGAALVSGWHPSAARVAA